MDPILAEARANAGRARAAQVAQRTDRPRQRRSAAEPSASARMSARSLVTVRDVVEGESVHFTGLASATEQAYEMWDWLGPYTEIVSAGAFENTLNRADLDVPLVLQHNQLRRIARTSTGTLTLAETDQGLNVDAPSLDMRDQDVAYIVPKLRAGLIDEMSFGFRIVRGKWSPDYTEYRIDEVDIHRGDVAIVGYGANPFTDAGVRQHTDPAEARSFERARPLALRSLR